MAKLRTAQFLADTGSYLTFNRALTTEELASLMDVKKSAVAAGHQVSPDQVDVQVDPDTEVGTYTYTNFWTESSDANAYVAVANGFSPAPTSAIVIPV
jgi:hypothetical protein